MPAIHLVLPNTTQVRFEGDTPEQVALTVQLWQSMHRTELEAENDRLLGHIARLEQELALMRNTTVGIRSF